MKKEKKAMGNKNFLDAWKNAFNGFKYSFKTQRNIRIQTIIAIITLVLGIILKLNIIEWVCLILTIFIVITTEMINTAIEATVDLYTEEFHEKAKIAKDVSAGAVILAVINSVIVGYLLFATKIFSYIK